MESAILGVVLDSSVLIAAERANLTTAEVMKTIRSSIGNLPIVISAQADPMTFSRSNFAAPKGKILGIDALDCGA